MRIFCRKYVYLFDQGTGRGGKGDKNAGRESFFSFFSFSSCTAQTNFSFFLYCCRGGKRGQNPSLLPLSLPSSSSSSSILIVTGLPPISRRVALAFSPFSDVRCVVSFDEGRILFESAKKEECEKANCISLGPAACMV